MVSRSARVGQAFGSKGVLNNAAKAEVEAVAGGVEPVANEAALGLSLIHISEPTRQEASRMPSSA